MKKNKFSIRRLFYNDKFVMIFSVLVSIILWFTVALLIVLVMFLVDSIGYMYYHLTEMVWYV